MPKTIDSICRMSKYNNYSLVYTKKRQKII